MAIETIKIPDIGGGEAEVIEICVQEGDTVEQEDSLVVLESDKSSMEVPAPSAGKVVKILVKEGDQMSEGAEYIQIETGAAETPVVEELAAKEPVASAPASGGAEIPVAVPDIGSESAEVIEMCVAVGDVVAEGDSLIAVESDKASLEVPSPAAGKVVSLLVKEGDSVSQGVALCVLEGEGGASAPAPVAEEVAAQPAPAAASAHIDITVPDIGGSEDVDVIEVNVTVGDVVAEGDTLITVESDKASMEIPSSVSGKVLSVVVKEGDKVSMGADIGIIEVEGQAPAAVATKTVAATETTPAETVPVVPAAAAHDPVSDSVKHTPGGDVYAGPAVRKLARQLGVNLAEIKATGPRGRMSKDDVRDFVKQVMENRSKGGGAANVTGGSGIPPVPPVDFAKFGEIEMQKMSKIKKLTAANMSRNWLNVPHVTQFDDADITEMEAFRKGIKAEAEKKGVKVTPLPFLIKACAAALVAEPSFNVSMHHDGEHIVQKKYVNIGLAVDTPNGLVVPVIRDADKKSLYEIAADVMDLAGKARNGKLKPAEMQGGCFTISSLGAIGGQGFTPIVNAPEVAILGVSRAETKPVWNGSEFMPRLMLPLSLSYDHRAINGGDAGRFFTYLNAILSDIRRLIL